MSYYEDDSKITFDRAETIVEKYLREYGEQRCRVTCKDVARAMGVEESHHNLIRLNSALDDALEATREAGSKASQYKVE